GKIETRVAIASGFAPRPGAIAILPDEIKRGRERFGCRIGDQSRRLIDDKLQWTTRIATRNDRLTGEHRLERYVAIIFVNRWVDHRECAGIARALLVLIDATQPLDPFLHFQLARERLQLIRVIRMVRGTGKTESHWIACQRQCFECELLSLRNTESTRKEQVI